MVGVNTENLSLAKALKNLSKSLSKSHQVFLPNPSTEIQYVTHHGVAHYVDWMIENLPRLAPSLEAVTWLPRSGQVGKVIAQHVAKKADLKCFPLNVVRGMPFNTLIIAPRLDLANSFVSADLYDYMMAKKRGLPPLAGYHDGDYLIWSLVVEPDTQQIAQIWRFRQTPNYRVYTCMDHALLGM